MDPRHSLPVPVRRHRGFEANEPVRRDYFDVLLRLLLAFGKSGFDQGFETARNRIEQRCYSGTGSHWRAVQDDHDVFVTVAGKPPYRMRGL